MSEERNAAWLQLKVAELQIDGDLKEELLDVLADYDKQAETIQFYTNMYMRPDPPIRDRNPEVWLCPVCRHRVHPKHTYCHWCGKLLRNENR